MTLLYKVKFMQKQRHPRIESALTLDDVTAGVAYVTYIPGQQVVERGIFTTDPYYDEVDRWTAGAKVQNGTHEIIERLVSLHGSGITPDFDGEGWAEAVTVADSE